MHYYCLSFHYHDHNWDAVQHIRRNPDFELDHGSFFLMAAEDYVHDLAEKAKIEMQHCYSWPDGSLAKYIRTPDPMDVNVLKKIFLGAEPRTLTTKDGTAYIVSVSLSDVIEKDGDKVHSTEYISLHERWTLSREEIHKLYMHRHQLREEHFSEYRHHRDTCPKCPKPWGVACPDGSELCNQALTAASAFIESLSSS